MIPVRANFDGILLQTDQVIVIMNVCIKALAVRAKVQPIIELPRPAGPVTVEVMNGNRRMEAKFPAGSEGVQ